MRRLIGPILVGAGVFLLVAAALVRFYAYPAHNGTGIGLALCRQIMRAWNAEIRCVSREHADSIFVLEFPVQRSTTPSGAP